MTSEALDPTTPNISLCENGGVSPEYLENCCGGCSDMVHGGVNDMVYIDATDCGNASRSLNHTCEDANA